MVCFIHVICSLGHAVNLAHIISYMWRNWPQRRWIWSPHHIFIFQSDWTFWKINMFLIIMLIGTALWLYYCRYSCIPACSSQCMKTLGFCNYLSYYLSNCFMTLQVSNDVLYDVIGILHEIYFTKWWVRYFYHT